MNKIMNAIFGRKNKMNKIMEIINEWDPIGLFPLAPEDEYYFEINDIENVISENPKISEEELAQNIDEIFLRWFNDIYESDLESCRKVAEKILHQKNK